MIPRTTLSAFTCALALTGGLRPQEPEQEPTILRLIPMQLSWENGDSAGGSYPVLLQLHHQLLYDDVPGPLSFTGNPVGVDLDLVVELLDLRFDLEESELEVYVDSDFLAIRGVKERVAMAEEFLGELRGILRPEVEITATLWSLGSDSADFNPKTVLSRQEVAQLQREGVALWRGHSVTDLARITQMGATEDVPYVADHEIEIAKEARVGDPQVRSLVRGLGLRLEVEPSVDGDELTLFGDLMYNRAEVGDRFFSLGLDYAGLLDAPVLRETRTTFAAKIPNGGAAAIWSFGESEHSPNFVVTIQVEREAQPVLEGLRVIGTGGLKSDRLVTPNTYRPTRGADRGDESMSWDEPERSQAAAATEAFVDSVLSNNEDDVRVMEGGGFLFVEARSTAAAEILAGLLDLERQLHQNVQIDLQTEAVPLNRPSAGTMAPSKMVWDRLIVPGLTSHTMMLRRGRESTEVLDYDVEIAEAEQARNPLVVGVFSGFMADVSLKAEIGDRVRASMRGDLSESGYTRRQSLGDEKSGDLWIHDTATSPLLSNGRFELSRRIGLGDSVRVTVDDDQWILRPSLTLR